jgi:phytanoyl-CoA hydroxylase
VRGPGRVGEGVADRADARLPVFQGGRLLPKPLPNTGRHGFRRALVHPCMRASSLLPWAPPCEDVPVAQADFRDIVLVAARDPYAYKGTVGLRVPRVRPDRSGGCER